MECKVIFTFMKEYLHYTEPPLVPHSFCSTERLCSAGLLRFPATGRMRSMKVLYAGVCNTLRHLRLHS